jgi:nucleoside-diphosphate-sugar epimerase
MTRSALVVGASGIVGNNLARHLHVRGWQVYGLARRPSAIEGVQPVAADLLDPASLRAALQGLRPTDVFIGSWLRQNTEAENIRVNSAMVRNLLEALSPAGSVRHVALVTGLKHYLGPFEAYGRGKLPATPFREEQPRLDLENFYYAQEDEVFAAAERGGFGWSVHRPHTITGYAVGNATIVGGMFRPSPRSAGRPVGHSSFRDPPCNGTASPT